MRGHERADDAVGAKVTVVTRERGDGASRRRQDHNVCLPDGGCGRRSPADPASPVMGSPAAHRNGSLQSRKNETATGILEDQSDGDGGA
jgi:hypothetical protein